MSELTRNQTVIRFRRQGRWLSPPGLVVVPIARPSVDYAFTITPNSVAREENTQKWEPALVPSIGPLSEPNVLSLV